MRYSFILPVYNVEKYLCQCIDSIIMQDNNNYEIILIDDGSSDKTTEIANSIESEKIKVFTLDKNRGKGYALNYGLKKTMKNATIIGFLDGDLGNTASEVEKLITPIINNECDVTITVALLSATSPHINFLTRLRITGSSPSNVSSKNIYLALVESASIIAACLFIPFEKFDILLDGSSPNVFVSSANLSISKLSYIEL